MDKKSDTGLFDALLEDGEHEKKTGLHDALFEEKPGRKAGSERKLWPWIAIAGPLVIVIALSVYFLTKKPHEKIGSVNIETSVKTTPVPQVIPKADNTAPVNEAQRPHEAKPAAETSTQANLAQQEKPESIVIPAPPPVPPAHTLASPDPNRMKSFISDYLRANEQKEIEKVLSFYGDNVDYYSYGKMPKSYIYKDKEKFFSTWHKLAYSLYDDLKIVKGGNPDTARLEFTFDFEMELSKKTIKATAQNIWDIENPATNPRIVSEKQKILKRN